jgi:hypothetical protein
MDHSLGVTALNGINNWTATNLMDQSKPFTNAFLGSSMKRSSDDCEAPKKQNPSQYPRSVTPAIIIY